VARTCSVCTHPESFAINEALVIQKLSNRAAACQYELNREAIRRHRAHIPQLLFQASRNTEEFVADQVLLRVERLERETLAQLEGAKEDLEDGEDEPRSVQRKTILNAIREQRENLRIVAQIRELIDKAPSMNIHLNPEWIELRTTLLHALDDHPAARESVLQALESTNSKALELDGGEVHGDV
jgi:hypothetical protein